MSCLTRLTVAVNMNKPVVLNMSFLDGRSLVYDANKFQKTPFFAFNCIGILSAY